MDQRYYSPLSKSSEQQLQPLDPTAPWSEPSKSTLLSLSTGLDPENPHPNLTDSVDTDVVESVNPAVTHEHVQPVHHTRHEERITREVHTHDVYHRVLPVLDTEILPPRHFIDDGQAVREVPASEVWKYTVTGAAPGYYRQPKALHGDSSPPAQVASAHREHLAAKQEPILADKKTYITEGGYPRTEYLWLHPPVFLDAAGRTQPVLVPAGLTAEWKKRLGVADGQLAQRARSVVVMAEEDALVPRREGRGNWEGESGSGALWQEGGGEPVSNDAIYEDEETRAQRRSRNGPNDQLVREAEEEVARRQVQQI